MRKRNLSEFMCIEMLYDYKVGKLDPLRMQAVEECIQNSPRVREELKKLSQGLNYCEKLKAVKVSQPLIDMISNHPKPSEKALKHISWKLLPQPIRWGIEGVVVSLALVLFVFQYEKFFKSDKVKEQSVVYKKFDLEKGESIPVTETMPIADKTIKPVAKLELPQEVPTIAAPTPKTAVAVPVTAVIPEKISEVDKYPKIEDRKVVAAEPLLLAIQQPSAEPSVSTVNAKKDTAKKGNAYVYRMVMFVENVDKITPELVAMMKTLGAEKAGEVELGWRRKGGSYFHFTIPQVNNQALQENLRKYSQFNLIKSNHPRVMPEGIERFILWVEEKKAGEEATSTPSSMPSNMEGQPSDGTEAP